MRPFSWLLLGAMILVVDVSIGCSAPPSQEVDPDMERIVLDHTVTRIDGTPQDLREYKGDVVLVVNVASKCGFTGQYEGLEALYQQRKDQGLIVLGFPSNDFLGQEPGSNEQIAQFCRATYGVSFPMFEKISVKGKKRHPLFTELTEAAGAPSWNFNKYLVDRDGQVVARFGSRTKPDDPDLVARIDELLAEAPIDAESGDSSSGAPPEG